MFPFYEIQFIAQTIKKNAFYASEQSILKCYIQYQFFFMYLRLT